MWIFTKYSYLVFFLSFIAGHEAFCGQASACNGIVKRKEKSTAFFQQDFSDSLVSGTLRIGLVAESKTSLRLTLRLNDYQYPVSEKDSLGILNYVSPYEPSEGMDVLLLFSENDSLLLDGKQTLENLQPIYKNQLEDHQLDIGRYPPSSYANIRRTFLLAYRIELAQQDIALLQAKSLQYISVAGSNIRIPVPGAQAAQLKSLVNCLMESRQ